MRAFTHESRCKIKNATLLLPTGIHKNKSIVFESEKIIEISDDQLVDNNMPTLDAEGLFVAPGCIDTHIHGGGGHDFTEATPEAFRIAASAHARYGTTALFPTLAAAPLSVFKEAIHVCETIMQDEPQGARILGLHLEGNYLNKIMCGGQNPAYLTLPDVEEYKDLVRNTSCIKRWSAAPELPGALAFGRFMSEQGILVSLAHTVADYPLVAQAWEAGYTHATHFYNAMTGVHKQGEYKKEGTIESVYLIKDMTVELISDGVHVPPAILKLVYTIKGADKIMLITDAMAPSACTNPVSHDSRVIIEDGVCKLADRSALAGSVATSDRLIRTMVKQAGIPLSDAVRMASETPARIMGIYDRKGSLEVGKDADIIIFDDNIEIHTTIVEGRIVYSKK
ncbi:N-acetylglucosamine-6-phosphate deacetylase [Massilibacteroides sp.]|uniref:N-acetylglucosamine-6-phosphate deacetylase n=1 Tax=Massilibacteroides sp. TaxID=2034766 RepID=UPI00261ED052|nr:N-acetylglucosamine-6-phosphate deacetylase [Massilibacteroides sp.]MDD4515927.1 N-acetylglucosamine-6-phosphate deacetylase [Massilibacteroides sp.]